MGPPLLRHNAHKQWWATPLADSAMARVGESMGCMPTDATVEASCGHTSCRGEANGELRWYN